MIVKVDQYDRVVSGASYMFRSREAALAESRRSTSAPWVMNYDVGDRTYYLAGGDGWRNGQDAGYYVYGRGGKLVDVRRVDAAVRS